jgi:hypothetical protein
VTKNRLRGSLAGFFKDFSRHPRATLASQLRVPALLRGKSFAQGWSEGGKPGGDGKAAARVETPGPSDPLHDYFDAHREGPGIFKWLHYFELYHRHLAKFVGKDIHVIEIGVFSGGSMGMWRSYFGPGARITGVDIEPACKTYENEFTKIVIGDQEDRSFWEKFRAEVPPADVIIEDGGHEPDQQMVTLEELLPHLKPGGVYICEDIHFVNNSFAAFMAGLDDALNAYSREPKGPAESDLSIVATPFQSRIHSIHHYPYVVVIEKREQPITHLRCTRRGTEWQPIQL